MSCQQCASRYFCLPKMSTLEFIDLLKSINLGGLGGKSGPMVLPNLFDVCWFWSRLLLSLIPSLLSFVLWSQHSQSFLGKLTSAFRLPVILFAEILSEMVHVFMDLECNLEASVQAESFQRSQYSSYITKGFCINASFPQRCVCPPRELHKS